jgi:hypothetical protein
LIPLLQNLVLQSRWSMRARSDTGLEVKAKSIAGKRLAICKANLSQKWAPESTIVSSNLGKAGKSSKRYNKYYNYV